MNTIHVREKVKDPVCAALVDPHEIEVVYLNTHFAFCSRHCEERFANNPNHYMRRLDANEGEWPEAQRIKERRWYLDRTTVSNIQSETIKGRLETIEGVIWTLIAGDMLHIKYDLLQVTGKQIERDMIRLGFPLSKKMVDRMQRSFMHYLEESELAGGQGDSDIESSMTR
jgi:YHS domain-containing protein